MSKKANPTLIGSFVIGGIAIIVFSIYFFASQTMFSKKDRFILYFPQSVNGLDVGVAVKFKGVIVGRVSAILLHFEGEKEYVPVVIEIPKGISKRINFASQEGFLSEIDKGLRASLGLQSFLTGKYFVELDFFPNEEAVFIGKGRKYREIPTVKSDYEKMWIAARKTLTQLSDVNFKGTFDDLKSAASKLESKLDELNAKDINDKLISSLDSFGAFSKKLDKQVDPVAEDFKVTLHKANGGFDAVKKAANSFDNMVNPDAPDGGDMNTTLDEISKTARSIRALTDYLERNPNALLTGKK